ncbi:hypothetical protein BS78_04G105100 [Paspalum vaginatum]|nr:hypothetical protein BS78_04G105100 [Paspalum vaginatum]
MPLRGPSSSTRTATSATAPTPPPRAASQGEILNTVDDLALLRVPVCSEGCIVCHSLHHDYFVYHAGSESKPPSLDLIPLPPGGVNPSDPQEAETKRRPVLKGRWAGYPALSSQDDDVVYISDRYDGRDRTASVIAVDLRKQTVRDVAEFGSERPLGYSYIYLGSGISKHLPPTRGKSSEASKKEIVQAVKHDVPGKNLQSEPTSKVDGTSPK